MGGRGASTVCRFKRGPGEKEGVVFLRGVDTKMHTISTLDMNKCETVLLIYTAPENL